MNRYLKIALWIAILSLIISGGILLLNFSILKKPSGQISITDISQAITAIIGSVLSSIAIIAVIVSQKSEVISTEKLKVDLVSIVNMLISVRNRCYLYTAPEAVNYEIDLFHIEREKLQDYSNSSSAYAIYIWNLQSKSIEGFDINIEFASLIDHMTLKFDEKYRQIIFNKIAKRCTLMINYLTEIGDKDFKGIANHLKKIGIGLQHVKETINQDPFSELGQDMIESDLDGMESLDFPSDEDLEKILAAADKKIGGKARDSVMHFINEAKNGDKKSLWYFYELVRKLKLDE